MISVRGPKMTGRQSLIICALTLSGPGALLSGRDLAFFLTCHSPEIKRLIDGREVDTDLLRDRYTAFLGQVQRGLCGISTDSCKKTGWINLLRISYLLNKFAYKKSFLNQVARFFKLAQSTASRVWWNRVRKPTLDFMRSLISWWTKRQGLLRILIDFMGAWMSRAGWRVSLNVLSVVPT